jgi:hypothetical protein
VRKTITKEKRAMDEFEMPPATKTVEARDVSKERHGLYIHSLTEEGQNERFEARLQVRIKPTTVARLKLFCDAYENECPLIDEVVDTALEEYLRTRAW